MDGLQNRERKAALKGAVFHIICPVVAWDAHLYPIARLFFPQKKIRMDREGPIEDLAVEPIGDTGIRVLFQDGSMHEASGQDKESVKRALYDALAQRLGQTLSWGTLVGVRPTKIAQNLLREGCSAQAILNCYETDYRVQPDKAQLAIRVAKTQKELLERFGFGRIGFYLHLPFCPSRCSYCSFLSYPLEPKERLAAYIHALLEDLERTGAHMRQRGLTPSYVYFGGGTPTAPDAKDFERILQGVDRHILRGVHPLEYTVEAGRPDGLTREKLQLMKQYGVTRISVNPQTFCDQTRLCLGRTHSSADVLRAVGWARDAGLEWINMDLILGLPGEGVREVENTLRQTLALGPENITVHGLAYKKGAALWEEALPLAKELPALGTYVTKELMKAGYEPYYLYRNKNTVGHLENIGFSKSGKQCRYNMAMMEEMDSIIACGASAVSKAVVGMDEKGAPMVTRQTSYKDLDLYLEGFEAQMTQKLLLLDEMKP
ncbi:putative radical SAM family enzyme [Clostridiaceae bacterium JG1575]|nr:putative radical SAM family enzyme [Clostridiaceae bacterium JG1575]